MRTRPLEKVSLVRVGGENHENTRAEKLTLISGLRDPAPGREGGLVTLPVDGSGSASAAAGPPPPARARARGTPGFPSALRERGSGSFRGGGSFRGAWRVSPPVVLCYFTLQHSQS